MKQAASAQQTSISASQPATKKRKLEEIITNGSAGWTYKSKAAAHIGGDVSFSVPQRKKLRLEWLDAPSGGIRAANPTSGDLEFGVSWSDIDHIFALPVPEKPKKQYNFVVIPKGGHGLLPLAAGAPEPIIWTVFELGPKEIDAPPEPQTSIDLLNKQLASFSKTVTVPNSDEFASALPQANRKGEPAYHVKAHRGAKDGYLFFLGNGILFAFKKPLLCLPFEVIESVSYTSVLQRTFNLNISTSTTDKDGETKEEEIEFAMLDQADFAGIDEYIKRHELHDASLAAGRRAAVYNVNKGKGGKDATAAPETNGHAEEVGADGLTDLQRAQQALEDAEDELEEDYVDEEEEDYSGSDEDEEEGEGPLEEAGDEMEEDEEVEE